MAKIVKKTAPIINSDIKQPQGGCPAINHAEDKWFSGYSHKVSDEERLRWEDGRKEFWESRGFDYSELKIKL